MKTKFDIYARIRAPFTQSKLSYEITNNNDSEKLLLKLKNPIAISNYKSSVPFKFKKVFGFESSQDNVFNNVSKSVLKTLFEGYNCTIFAYGQTGSGKTYTMSGVSDNWEQRGIIPRALQKIFKKSEKKKLNIYISYLEIYNDNAYDLLNKDNLDKPLEGWEKITVREDEYGNPHLKNLSINKISDLQTAIDLLLMGNYIRQVSSTPMNLASSRSHCIFIITIEQQKNNGKIVSKLNLVDLAGSERSGKHKLEGQIFTESKYINLSLSYLEQVIVMLSDKGGKNGFIPYRNSLLTTILKDSLGGNCKTCLISCLAGENTHIEETISTCKFAMRCAKIENTIKQNKIYTSENIEYLIEENKRLNEFNNKRINKI